MYEISVEIDLDFPLIVILIRSFFENEVVIFVLILYTQNKVVIHLTGNMFYVIGGIMSHVTSYRFFDTLYFMFFCQVENKSLFFFYYYFFVYTIRVNYKKK